jgi:hypothetical protein
MKTYKTIVLCIIKTELNELMNLEYNYFVIIAPFDYKPALAEIHITKQNIV